MKRCKDDHDWTHHQVATAEGIRWVKVCATCGMQWKGQ